MSDLGSYKLGEYFADLHRWRYQFFSLETPHELFEDFLPVLSMYKAKGQGGIPSWRDMDFYDFVGWHGRVSLHQVLEEPFHLKVRLFGSIFSEYFEQDWTGQILDDNSYSDDDLEGTALLIKEDFDFYRHVAKDLVMGAAYGPAVWLDKEFKHFTTLCLPLVDDTGKIDKLLNVIISSSDDRPFQEM